MPSFNDYNCKCNFKINIKLQPRKTNCKPPNKKCKNKSNNQHQNDIKQLKKKKKKKKKKNDYSYKCNFKISIKLQPRKTSWHANHLIRNVKINQTTNTKTTSKGVGGEDKQQRKRTIQYTYSKKHWLVILRTN